VDVVTARSVLIFLPWEQKRRAIAEAHRVLRPGGRLSVFEPINRVAYPEPDDRLMGFDVAPVAGLAARVKAVGADSSPTLLDFDQRDLLGWTLDAGFRRVRLDYEVSLTPIRLDTTDWDVLLRMAPNPLAPTLGEKTEAALTAEEATRFASYLRPLVEGGAPRTGRSAVAYLRAVKT
jgi:arsenite methyltransferase